MESFKNMNELVEYLGKLEERVQVLEAENTSLRTSIQAQGSTDANAISHTLINSLPQTDLLSKSFWRRAFAVYGHFFVVNLMIGLVFFVIYLCLMVFVFGSAYGSLR